jgi:chitinase
MMIFGSGHGAVWRICLTLLVAAQIGVAVAEQGEAQQPPYRCGRRCEKIKSKIAIIIKQMNYVNAELQDILEYIDGSVPDISLPAQPPTTGDPVSPPKDTPSPSPSVPSYIQPSSPAMSEYSSSGYRAVAYYTNWGIYGRGYTPDKIPAENLTHILYAFADNEQDGTVKLTDTWSDVEKHWDGDSWNDVGSNIYGNLKQLNLLKQRNRNLKVLLSIGGWTYTNTNKHLDAPSSTPEGRKKFADTCVRLIKDLGFDGIDLDWEYPQDTQQGENMLLLLQATRKAMDDYATHLVESHQQTTRPHFLLTIASSAGKENYQNYPLSRLAPVLDFINLMGYDYSGAWDTNAGHQSSLYMSKSCPTCTPFDTVSVIQDYMAAGVPSDKIVLGMPLYGRAFTNTDGIGKPFQGVGEGSWENGIWDYKELPRPGAREYYDEEAGATYSYDNSTMTLVSYDTPENAVRKAKFIEMNNLGGAMWWELNGDKTGSDSLITTVVNELGGPDGSRMERASNWIYYPDSQYDNVKNGFK